MEELRLKYEKLLDGLSRLSEAVEDAEKIQDREAEERAWRSLRDSMIKRFEFSIELFWKYVKKYLESVGFLTKTPKEAIRQACQADLIEVDDAETFLNMLDDRNRTSHLYQEDLADRIGSRIPMYFRLMEKYSKKLSPKKEGL